MNRSILGLAATLALVGSSQAAGLVDNFESYNSLNDDMNGKGTWTVSNPTGPEGAVVILDNFTWDGSTRSATVGGVAQTALGLTALSSVVDPGVQLGNASIKWEMRYTESTEGPRNPYKFVVQANSQNLLTLDLTPAGANQYTLSWGSALSPSGTTGPVGLFLAAQSTQIQLNTWWNGTNVQYALSNAGAPVSSGVLATASQTSNVNSFSASWDSTGGAGNGSITIDNVSIVPEPSSALLGLLGATFAFARRRRA